MCFRGTTLQSIHSPNINLSQSEASDYLFHRFLTKTHKIDPHFAIKNTYHSKTVQLTPLTSLSLRFTLDASVMIMNLTFVLVTKPYLEAG